MLVVAGHAPRRRLPLVWFRLVWSCLVRAVGYLIGKVPGRALDEMFALGSFVAHPRRLTTFRKRAVAVEHQRNPRLSSLSVRNGGAACGGVDALTGAASSATDRWRATPMSPHSMS
jgi:hypothetical protein